MVRNDEQVIYTNNSLTKLLEFAEQSQNNRDSKTTDEYSQIIEKIFNQIRKVLNSSKDKRCSNIELVLKYSYYIYNESGEKSLRNKIFINDNKNDDKVQLKIKQQQMIGETIDTDLEYLKLSIKTLASFTAFNIENILDHTQSFSTQKSQNIKKLLFKDKGAPPNEKICALRNYFTFSFHFSYISGV